MSTIKKAEASGRHCVRIPKNGLAPMLAFEWIATRVDNNVLLTVINSCDYLTLRFSDRKHIHSLIQYINDNLGL